MATPFTFCHGDSKNHKVAERTPQKVPFAAAGRLGPVRWTSVKTVCVNAIFVTVALCLASRAPVAASAADQAPTQLAAAQHAYEQNRALGDSLRGSPATPEQAEEAERLFQDALAKVRACLAQDPGSAEAHRLAGMLLCTAYRPVSVRADAAPEHGAAETVTILIRGGRSDCEEGLDELRASLRLKRKDPSYSLDYAEALFASDKLAACEKQALRLWDKRPDMSNLQCARCARILADCAQTRNRPEAEMQWMRAAVKYNPQDAEVAQRLAALVAAQPKIVWLSYEAGKALAETEKKPMLIDFKTDWCGWCRKLERDVFTHEDVVACCKQFVCIEVDGTNRRDLATAFSVRSYPTAVVLDHTGRELRRIVGYRPAARYVAELQTALPIE